MMEPMTKMQMPRPGERASSGQFRSVVADSVPHASQDSPRVRFLLIRSEENPATMAPIKAPSSRSAVRSLEEWGT